MSKLYYTPPTNEQFQEMKRKAIEVWQQYDNQFGYVTEKVRRIQDVGNYSDNFMFMVAMFDHENQMKLANKLSPATRKAVRERLIDVEYPEYLIVF